MVIGNRECRDVKSSLFNPGQSFLHTFNTVMVCVIDSSRQARGGLVCVRALIFATGT